MSEIASLVTHGFPENVRLEDRACPNGCVCDDALVLETEDRLNGIPGRFSVVRCNGCHLLRTNPRPTAATIHAYYPTTYGPYHTGDESTALPTSWLRRGLRTFLEFDAKALPPIRPGRLLEVGCASGSFLDAQRLAGWTVEGIEFNESAVERARARDLYVQNATVETARAPESRVDVVAAWMVLEHLHEPIHALRRIREWVKSDGWLVASVPDTSSFFFSAFRTRSYDLQVPTHLYHFTPRTLGTLMSRAGWRIVRVRWQRNPNTLLMSVEYLASDNGWGRTLAFTRWLRTAPRAGKLRACLALLLGVARQSGRMEIWARPMPDSTST